jgi:hypothetical protein
MDVFSRYAVAPILRRVCRSVQCVHSPAASLPRTSQDKLKKKNAGNPAQARKPCYTNLQNPDKTMRVKCYFNLHKKLFSVVAMEGDNKGRVIAHVPNITLENAEFKVSEAGRQRVIREKRKNVHAFVVGEWARFNAAIDCAMGGIPVTYNPYKFPSFVRTDTLEPVRAATYARLSGRQAFAYGVACHAA